MSSFAINIDERELISMIKKDNVTYMLDNLPNNLYKKYIIKETNFNESLLKFNPPLYSVSAYYGATKCITAFIQSESDFSIKDRKGLSISDFAVIGGCFDIVKMLSKFISFEYSIHHAAQSGNYSIVRFLIQDLKVSKNKLNVENRTPLHCASISGDLGCIKLLANNDYNKRDLYGNTALLFAIRSDRIESVKYLMNIEGIEICPMNDNKESIFHFASICEKADILSYILSVCGKSGILDIKRWDFMTLDCYAIENDFDLEDIKAKNTDEMLVIDIKTKDGNTPLMYAAQYKRVQPFNYLMSMGADPTLVNNRGRSVLHFASESGSLEIIDILIKTNDVNVNQQDECGVTPLIISVRNGLVDCVQILLKNPKVDPNICDKNGWYPLHYASKLRFTKIVQLLLSKNIDINCRNNDNETPLYVAAKQGNLEIFKILLDREDVNPNAQDKHGASPLHAAARYNQLEITSLLLNKPNININIQDNEGWTPLHYSVRNAHRDIVMILSNSPLIDFNIKDIKDKTPLHFAMNHDIKVYLESRGAI